jgi:hypothetical protein
MERETMNRRNFAVAAVGGSLVALAACLENPPIPGYTPTNTVSGLGKYGSLVTRDCQICGALVREDSQMLSRHAAFHANAK